MTTFSTELTVFFSAMTPLDLKLAIPLGRELGLSATSTYLFAVTGAIVPGAIFLAIIGPVSIFLRKHFKYMEKFFQKLFDKTRKAHSKKFTTYGAAFIILFVGIPVIPGSGTVAASLICFLFGVDYWKSLSMISIGAMMGGIVITAGFESITKILDLFI